MNGQSIALGKLASQSVVTHLGEKSREVEPLTDWLKLTCALDIIICSVVH